MAKEDDDYFRNTSPEKIQRQLTLIDLWVRFGGLALVLLIAVCIAVYFTFFS